MANIKHNLVYNFLLSCSQVLIPIVSIPYISWALDPDGIGRVSFIDSFTYYFITIAEFGIMVYGIREVARQKDDADRLRQLVSELVALHLLSSLFSIVLYSIGVIALWNKINDLRLLGFSLSYLLVNSFACEWYFMGMEKFRYIAIRSLITRVLGLASIFILVKGPVDYWIYYAIIVVSAVANSLWNNFVLVNELKISFRKVDLRKHLRYTWITYAISLVYSITLMLDVVLLRLVSSDAATGIYSFAMRVVKLVSILVTDSLLVFFPRIVSLHKEENKEPLYQKLMQNIQLIILLAIPMGAGLFLLSDEIVLTFMGNKFIDVAADLRILAWFPFLKAYNLFLGKQVLIADNKEKAYLVNLLISSVCFVVLTLVFSTLYADQGACYAIVISEFILLVLNFVYVKRIDKVIPLFDPGIGAWAVGTSLLFIPVVYGLRLWIDSTFVVLVLAILVCIIIYFLIQIFVARIQLILLMKSTLLGFLANLFNKARQ